MKSYIVYVYTNLKDGKKYIGQTSKMTLEERAGPNFINYKQSTIFYNALINEGAENFKREIVQTGLTHDEANLLEIELIKKYKTQNENFGYNIQNGGSSFVMNDEIKKKIGLAVKKSKRFQVNNFLSHRKEVVSLTIANKEITYFKSITEAAKLVGGSRGSIGCLCAGNSRAKSLYGRLWFFKDNFNDSMIDIYVENFNADIEKRYSSDRNKKISDTKRSRRNSYSFEYLEKKVCCVETGEIFRSIKEAAEKSNIKAPSNIREASEGKRKTAGGFHWKFV